MDLFIADLSFYMHQSTQYMLIPVLLFVILLIASMIFVLVTLVVEAVTSRRHFKVNSVQTITALRNADYQDIPEVIAKSSLLKSQAKPLMRIAQNMGLPDEELYALATLELEDADKANRRRIAITDTVSKVAPMMGLAATLIPLGPGIVAMGDGDVKTLSESLLIAFDATVLGLLAATLSVIVSRIRRTWYGQYNTMMRSLMACILDEAERAREEGVQLPYGIDNNLDRELAETRNPDCPQERFESPQPPPRAVQPQNKSAVS